MGFRLPSTAARTRGVHYNAGRGDSSDSYALIFLNNPPDKMAVRNLGHGSC
jgi:hypothetical protein